MHGERKTVLRREKESRKPTTEPSTPVPPPAPAPRAEARPARAEPRPTRAMPPMEPAPHLNFDDLEAIAHMDMGELDRLMNDMGQRQRIEIGTKVTGTITRVGRDNVFVDVGAKSEAMLPREDLPEAAVGQSITAYVVDTDENGIQLSQRLSGSAAAAFLSLAAGSTMTVEGKITARNAGGFEVRVGGARAFCPMSQMERMADDEADALVGKTLDFLVLETGEKTVLSRRALIAAGLDEKRKLFWENAKIGDQRRGIVTSVQSFGVFVDLEGAEGLIPRRELSWEHDVDPSTRFAKGQPVDVRIVDLDHEGRKITLSARDPSLSPWSKVGTEFLGGGTYPARVMKLADYGAFVELSPGLQGLLHSSRFGKQRPKAGDSIEVRIQAIDHERQRLDLVSPDAEAYSAAAEGEKGAIVTVTVKQVLNNGLAVELEGGDTGWIPAREIDLPSGTILAQRFRAGRTVQARVVEVDASRRRTVLSLKLEADMENQWRGASQSAGPQSLGTFADLLGAFKAKR
jgi:small subunit ribosomal protein S1